MKSKEIIQTIENAFIKNHYKMDSASTQEDRQYFAGLSLELADLLATIYGTSQDAELERLYKKYNLFKEA